MTHIALIDTEHPPPRSIRIDVTGRPAPKGSRIFGRNSKGQTFTRPASKFEKPWVEAVRAATELQMRHHAQLRPPYVIELDLRIPRGAKRSAKPWPSQHDIDKLARAVVDGLVFGKAITDDRDVIELHVTKRFAEEEEPGVSAQIRSQE